MCFNVFVEVIMVRERRWGNAKQEGKPIIRGFLRTAEVYLYDDLEEDMFDRDIDKALWPKQINDLDGWFKASILALPVAPVRRWATKPNGVAEVKINNGFGLRRRGDDPENLRLRKVDQLYGSHAKGINLNVFSYYLAEDNGLGQALGRIDVILGTQQRMSVWTKQYKERTGRSYQRDLLDPLSPAAKERRAREESDVDSYDNKVRRWMKEHPGKPYVQWVDDDGNLHEPWEPMPEEWKK